MKDNCVGEVRTGDKIEEALFEIAKQLEDLNHTMRLIECDLPWHICNE